jgi:hypothetical protein
VILRRQKEETAHGRKWSGCKNAILIMGVDDNERYFFWFLAFCLRIFERILGT